ncbi:hypothetical protein EZS27_029661, partial [termite gut metagenome]
MPYFTHRRNGDDRLHLWDGPKYMTKNEKSLFYVVNGRFNPIEKRDRFEGIFIKSVYNFNQPVFYLPQAVKSGIFEFPLFPDMMPETFYRVYLWRISRLKQRNGYALLHPQKNPMLTPDKLTEIFCIADDFCKEFDLEAQKHQIET